MRREGGRESRAVVRHRRVGVKCNTRTCTAQARTRTLLKLWSVGQSRSRLATGTGDVCSCCRVNEALLASFMAVALGSCWKRQGNCADSGGGWCVTRDAQTVAGREQEGAAAAAAAGVQTQPSAETWECACRTPTATTLFKRSVALPPPHTHTLPWSCPHPWPHTPDALPCPAMQCTV